MKQNYQRKKFFYSKLYEEDINDKDYTRTNIVWQHFKIKNLGEYHDLYLMTDVYLLKLRGLHFEQEPEICTAAACAE